MLSDQNSRWLYNNIEAAWLVKPMQGPVICDTQVCGQHVVKMKYRPAARKTAIINVKNYNSVKRRVCGPDCTYKTAQIILP